MKRIALLGLALSALLLSACGGSSNLVEATEARSQGRAYERIADHLSAKPGVTRCSMVKTTDGFFSPTITQTISCEGDELFLPVSNGSIGTVVQ
jgi:hypothetical protein